MPHSFTFSTTTGRLEVALPSGGKTTLQFTDALTDSNIEFPGEMIGASSTAAYLLTQANENLVNATNIGLLTTGVAYFTTSGGIATISTKAIGTASGTIAAGDHTHSTYLTDAPSDGTLYGRLDGEWSAVTEGGSGGVEVYSETETAIGTWLGSTLYRKVINIGVLPNTTTKNVAHGISNMNYVSRLSGTAQSAVGQTLTLNHNNLTDLSNQITCYCNKTNVSVACASNRSDFSGYIVLEYTKTA